MRVAVIASVLLCCTHLQSLQAQMNTEHEWLGVHLRGGLGYGKYTSTISNFEGVADCGIFTNGSSIHPQFSLTFEYPVAPTWFVGVGARYADRSVTMYADNTSAPALDVTKQTGVDVVFENTIASTLPYLDIVPELRTIVSHMGRSTQRVAFGGIIALPMSPTFIQQQRIISPENAVYKVNNQQTVTISNGTQDIRSINKPLVGAMLALENLLPVGSSSMFTQQLSVEYMMNDIVSTAPWKVISIRADLGFRFSLQTRPAPPPAIIPPVKEEKPQPITEKPFEKATPLPILRARIDSLNVSLQTGNELRASMPLVNAVFFDQHSAAIPSRYFQRASDVRETDNALEYHRQILLSIARIVRDNPKAMIQVDGATSGSDEPEGAKLAQERAEAVRAALIQCGVAEDRISVHSQVNPRIASNADFSQGREENRRVDIILSNAPLQEYVARQKYAQLQGSMTYTIDAQYFNSGEIRVLSNVAKEQIFQRSETRTVDINQRLLSDTGSILVNIAAHAPPSLNSRDEVNVEIASLKREQVILNLQSFDAILRFDYNSSEFSQANKELLRQLVQTLPEGSTIQVLGSADAIGDEASNRQLSERRANSTVAFIKSIAAGKFNIESAVSTEKYDESHPEGRFLNRSIRIRVRE